MAVDFVIEQIEQNGQLVWLKQADRQAEIERLTTELTPKYGRWLVEAPALEDATQLAQDVANQLAKRGAITDAATALELRPILRRRTGEWCPGTHWR
ncbi:MAG: hypothetical protein U0805_18125 [Pirellulales bacterium]